MASKKIETILPIVITYNNRSYEIGRVNIKEVKNLRERVLHLFSKRYLSEGSLPAWAYMTEVNNLTVHVANHIYNFNSQSLRMR